MSTGVSNITTAASTNATAGTGKSSLGKDDFMKLLIAQMKYQDPMNPQDGAQYAAQLAQFSSLEQLSNMNKTLESSITANLQLTQSVNNTMTAALIGKEAKINTSTIHYNKESSVKIGFNLPAEASNITVKVYNKDGALVRTFEPTNKEIGNHTLEWDFKDSNGTLVNQGDYKFEVSAKNLQGKDMTVTSWMQGVISGIRFGEAGTRLVIGNSEYGLSDVAELFSPES